MCARAICVLFVAILASPGRTQTLSIWDHNGSTMLLDANGSDRHFYYENPRTAMIAQGATHGSELFEGNRSGNTYSGTAMIYSKKCGVDQYKVAGTVSDDERTLILQGRAPVHNQACQTSSYRDDTLVFTFVTDTLGTESPTDLCYFEAALVPCTKLQEPISTTEPGRETSYKFLKYVPLWPNQALFGGLAAGKPSDPSDYEHWQQFYNRARAYDASIPNILTAPLNSSVFDGRFVDSGLSKLDYMIIFRPQFFPRLVQTNQAFGGDSTFDRWMKALGVGIVCAPSVSPADGTSAKICAFARRTRAMAVEYCTYDEDGSSGIRSSVSCTKVADERDGKRWVIGTRYADYGPQGAGGEGDYSCVLPGKSLNDAAQMLEKFIRDYIGQSSKYSSRLLGNGLSIKAEGINIEDTEENVFYRVYLSGSVTKLERDSDFLLDVPQTYLYSPVITVLTSFTISAEASDNIVNYREPNEAMGGRLSNRFLTAMKNRAKMLSPGAVCGTSG